MDSSQPSDPPDRRLLYWCIVGIVSVAAALVIFLENNSFYWESEGYFSMPDSSPIASKSAPPTRVTIDWGGTARRAFQGSVEDGMTALSALRASALAGGFLVRTDEQGRLIAIGEAGAGAGREWRMYVNDAEVYDLPGHVAIRPGDKVTFRYE